MQKAAHFRFVSPLFHHTPAHHRILSVSPNTHVVSVLNPPPLISFLCTAQSRVSLSFSILSRSCVQHTETSCLVLVYYTELSVFLRESCVHKNETRCFCMLYTRTRQDGKRQRHTTLCSTQERDKRWRTTLCSLSLFDLSISLDLFSSLALTPETTSTYNGVATIRRLF